MTHQEGRSTETIIQLQFGHESKHITKIIAFFSDRLEFDFQNYTGIGSSGIAHAKLELPTTHFHPRIL